VKNVFLKNKTHFKKTHSYDKITCRKFFAYNKEEQEDIISHNVTIASSKVTEKKSKNKKIFNILFLIFNVILVVGVFYNFAREQGGIPPLSSLISNHPRWRYLFVALGLFLLTVIFNSLKTFILVHNKTKKWRPIFSFKSATMSKYYDLMTPFSSGGKPFEIYYLKKNNHSGDVATAIPLAKYMIWQFVLIVVCSSILIFYPHENIASSSPLIFVCAWIGLAVILMVFLFILFMSITKKWGAKIVGLILKVLHKLHLVKNYHTILRKVLRFVKSYQYSMKAFIKSPFTILLVAICTVGALFSNGSIAYFIYRAFVETPVVDLYDIFCKCIICDLAICIIPLPGGSGVSELSFNALVGSLFGEGARFWGILIWRVFTYYLHIVLGGIILIFGIILPKSKKHKNKLISK